MSWQIVNVIPWDALAQSIIWQFLFYIGRGKSNFTRVWLPYGNIHGRIDEFAVTVGLSKAITRNQNLHK